MKAIRPARAYVSGVGTAPYGCAMRRASVGSITIRIPESWRERRRGLLGLTELQPNEGLLLLGCRSIHTIGMRFAIDVVLLDRRFRVLAIVPMPPGRLMLPRPGVRHLLEVAPGALRCARGLRLRIAASVAPLEG
jgi:uncharacterized membrane protein (UPF0127 family)